MNAIERRQMAEGCLYNFHIQKDTSDQVIAALIEIHDTLRKLGVVIRPNDYGQLEVLDIGTRRELARSLFI